MTEIHGVLGPRFLGHPVYLSENIGLNDVFVAEGRTYVGWMVWYMLKNDFPRIFCSRYSTGMHEWRKHQRKRQ